MTPKFNEEKTTQLAGALLKLAGGKMYYLKLIKLMYIVDREGLIRWGRSMTNDRYFSLDNGCILSQTKNLITEETLGASYWKRFVSPPEHWQVELLAEPETDELSNAELSLIDEQYRKIQAMFGHLGADDRWAIADFTHNFPEWKKPDGSSLPNEYEEVLLGENISPERVRKTLLSLEEFSAFEQLVSK